MEAHAKLDYHVITNTVVTACLFAKRKPPWASEKHRPGGFSLSNVRHSGYTGIVV